MQRRGTLGTLLGDMEEGRRAADFRNLLEWNGSDLEVYVNDIKLFVRFVTDFSWFLDEQSV